MFAHYSFKITMNLYHSRDRQGPQPPAGDDNTQMCCCGSDASGQSTWNRLPGRWLSHHPWMCLRAVQMWCSGTWVSGELLELGQYGRAVVGLDDLEGLFQPEQFCDSMIPWFYDPISVPSPSHIQSPSHIYPISQYPTPYSSHIHIPTRRIPIPNLTSQSHIQHPNPTSQSVLVLWFLVPGIPRHNVT